MATYEITGPDGAVHEIEGPEGADPSQIIAQISEGQAKDQPQAPQRTIPQEVARQAGLGARGVVEGLAGLAALPSDALFGAINEIYRMRGEEAPFQLASESISKGLTAAGLPQPETGTERFATRVVGALGGAGGTIAIGRAMMGAAAPAIPGAIQSIPRPPPAAPPPLALATSPPRPPMTQAVGELLAAWPAAQGAGAVTGSTASQAAAALGAPLPIQIAAGMVGGAVPGVAGSIASATGRGAAGAAQPLTEGGRRTIAGQALRSAATNADDTVTRLAQSADDLVPSSRPTTAQVARDPGLAYFETRLRALGDPRFQQRSSAQNAARQALADSIADGGMPEQIAARVARREVVTTSLRRQAFSEAAGQRVPTERIVADIDNLMVDPENAGRSVQQALQSVRSQIVREGAREVQPDGTVVQQSQPLTDARALYAVRKEINRILEGRYVGADESVLRYAGGQLARVRDSIDEAITQVAPSWRQYLTKYAQLSRPIERAETMQDIRQRTALAAPDIATGRDFISQPKWRQVVARAMPELERTMTRGQITKLNRITADLDRGAAVAAAGKLPGSDTAANLALSGQISVANIVSRALGTPAKQLPPGLATAVRPLAFLYKLPDESVRQLLVEAALDPRLAEQLLREGTTANVRRFVDEFAAASRASTVGAASGVAAQQGAQEAAQ